MCVYKKAALDVVGYTRGAPGTEVPWESMFGG